MLRDHNSEVNSLGEIFCKNAKILMLRLGSLVGSGMEIEKRLDQLEKKE